MIKNAKSIMSVLALGAKKGQTVQIRVNGLDEENALEGVHSLFEQNFGE
ncbi:HPr family phosphocarrier protein [Tepidibacillus infernus]